MEDHRDPGTKRKVSFRALHWFLITVTLMGGRVPAAAAKNKACVVAIDIGHTESAQGAVSSRGVGEFTFNRNIANLLLQKLGKDGVAQAFIIDSTGMSLAQRTESASLRNANFLISIHHDSVQPAYLSTWTYQGATYRYSDRFHGFSLFISNKNLHPEESLSFARDIGSHLLSAGFTPSLHHAEKIKGENRELVDRKRGIYIFDDLIILKTAAMPAALLECGIIVNRQEETRLTDKTVQDELVNAVAAGIEEACKAFDNRSP
jgi:N-acetylmuramoyl-L-alanine amidase